MRPPTIQSGRYRVRYRQVPYVERFFFVDIKKDSGKWDMEFMKICSIHRKYDLPLQNIFGFFQTVRNANWNIDDELYKRLGVFMDKVAKYDNYLDNKD